MRATLAPLTTTIVTSVSDGLTDLTFHRDRDAGSDTEHCIADDTHRMSAPLARVHPVSNLSGATSSTSALGSQC